MDETQLYIGAQNGAVFCVDHVKDQVIYGNVYHSYRKEPEEIEGIDQLLSALENLYDSLNFPYPGVIERSFQDAEQNKKHGERRKKIVSDEELLRRHGELGTFIIRVQHRQNGTWQGRITWADEKKTLCFRSVWEMVKLIESALDAVGGSEDGHLKKSWDEE